MSYLLKGALVEYGSDFFGPIPNIVIFQFNPENLQRNLEIPDRPTGATARETTQAGEATVERISLTAYFNASDHLNDSHPLAIAFGVGTQLAALEKMVHPAGLISGALAEAVDRIGDAIRRRRDSGSQAAQPIPREKYPRILFIWGVTRVLPVIIESMNITEQKYDHRLNPVQAEVSLGLAVLAGDPCSDDVVAKGALAYSNLAKETQAMANVANTVYEQIEEIIEYF